MNEVAENNETGELFEHHRWTVDKGQAPMRIDKFIFNRLVNASRTKVQNAAEAGNILVNNKPVKSNYKVKPLDVISVVLTFPPRDTEIIPENIPLNIVYEDEHLVIVDKEAGMVVHPAYGNFTGTLVNALYYKFKDLPMFQSGEMRPGLVHRIDKNTSGILVIAKTELALNKLASQFFYHTIERHYTALVWGNLTKDSGTITGNIWRSAKDRKVMAVYDDPEIGKHAITHYKVIERFGMTTLVDCVLETGRTHQIRVHMKHIGHPLFSDAEYGGNTILKGPSFSKYKQFVENCFDILPRQALHARSLAFDHPATGKRVQFESPLPADMQQVIEKWRGYANNNKSVE
ncbi:MAG TPA: RluA family pseudouridine synthase [Bacteroidales bacterium]|nr:RluA family pseudouridine synthase [Bacteroidales bacterium]